MGRPHQIDFIGRGGAIRTPDPLRPRQVRYQAALRPDMYCSLDSKILSNQASSFHHVSSPKLSHNCAKTPLYWTTTEPKPFRSSLACRLIFSKASRFICNFICEYFLKTFASPCRSIWVTHSSATPPALSRVAYVERRS